MLFWNRRHPRQQPLPAPEPCIFPIKCKEPCCKPSVTHSRDPSVPATQMFQPPPTHPDDATTTPQLCGKAHVTITNDPSAPLPVPLLHPEDPLSHIGDPTSDTGNPISPLPAAPSFTVNSTLPAGPAHSDAPCRASELQLNHQLPELGCSNSGPQPHPSRGCPLVPACPLLPSPSPPASLSSSACAGNHHNGHAASSSCSLPLPEVSAEPPVPSAGTPKIAVPTTLPTISNASAAVRQPAASGPHNGSRKSSPVRGKTRKGLNKGKAQSSPPKVKAHSRSTRGKTAACPSKGRAEAASTTYSISSGPVKGQGPSHSTRSKAGSGSCKGKAGTGPTTGKSTSAGGQQTLFV